MKLLIELELDDNIVLTDNRTKEQVMESVKDEILSFVNYEHANTGKINLIIQFPGLTITREMIDRYGPKSLSPEEMTKYIKELP